MRLKVTDVGFIQNKSDHQPLNFALASSYYKQRDYKEASNWFEKIYIKSPDNSQALFGYSLCLFKLERYEDALSSIKTAIEQLDQEDKFAYICIRGLCYKELDNFELATNDYLFLKSFEKPKTIAECCNENLSDKESLNVIVTNRAYPYFLLTNEFYVKNDGWKHDRLDKASALIKRIPFFKRLTAIHIKAYLCYFEVKSFKANKPIYVPVDTACIVVGGIMRHFKYCCKQKKSILTNLLIQGDFIFNSESFKPPNDFWLESITPIELIFI